uniref:Uncharacterized protein n=1 Tax=Ditylenchus dipsaci TaxID=166011 RepID=A0A915E546_9BILA
MMYAPRMPPMPKPLSQSPLGRKNGSSPRLNLQKQYSQIVSQYQDLLDLLLENNRLYYSLADRFDQLSWQFSSLVNEQSKTRDILETFKPVAQPVVQLPVEEAVTVETESKKDVFGPKEDAEKDSQTEDGKTDSTKKTDAKKIKRRKDKKKLQKILLRQKFNANCKKHFLHFFFTLLNPKFWSIEGTLEFFGQAAGFNLGFALCPPIAPLIGYVGRKLGGKLGGGFI